MTTDRRQGDERESLIGPESRIRRLSRMLPPRGPLSEQMREEVLRALVGYMHEAELSQADVAKAIGQSKTHVSNLLTGSGKLPDNARDQMLRDVNNWLDREARARENRRPERFVETRVARRLIDLAERLTERADMALAYGPAGIGKTLTAQAICAELSTVVYIMVDDDCRSPTGLRTKLYNALSRKKHSKDLRLAHVIEKLRPPARVSTVSLVIVDEAQDLHNAAFTMLRKIHEQARCSILFLGTVDIDRRLRGDDDPEFGQLSSRVGVRLNLARELATGPGGGVKERLFTVQDIRALFSQGKLKLHPSTTRMLATLANTTRGTLRRIERLHYWALKIALKRRAAAILPEHVQAAAGIVGDEDPLDVTDFGAVGRGEPANAAAG